MNKQGEILMNNFKDFKVGDRVPGVVKSFQLS